MDIINSEIGTQFLGVDQFNDFYRDKKDTAFILTLKKKKPHIHHSINENYTLINFEITRIKNQKTEYEDDNEKIVSSVFWRSTWNEYFIERYSILNYKKVINNINFEKELAIKSELFKKKIPIELENLIYDFLGMNYQKLSLPNNSS